MRVVPTQDTDSRAPAQALQETEGAAEDSAGGSPNENGKRQGPLHDLLADARYTRAVLGFLPTHHKGGK